MPVVINGSTGISGVDGSAGTPAFQGSDTNTGIRFGADIVSLVTGGSDRLYIDSSGRVGVGTSSPGDRLHVVGPAAGISARFSDGVNATVAISHPSSGTSKISDYGGNYGFEFASSSLNFLTAGSERMRIDSSGRVGIGTTNGTAGLSVLTYGSQLGFNGNSYMFPSGRHHVQLGNVANGTDVYAGFTSDYANTSGSCNIVLQPTFYNTSQQAGAYVAGEATGLAATAITFGHFNGGATTGGNATKQERARIDSSGRLLVGTASSSSDARLLVQGRGTDSTAQGSLYIQRGGTGSSAGGPGSGIGEIIFAGSDASQFATIKCDTDASTGANDFPGRLMFSVTRDGASSSTEAMRINSSGTVDIYTPVSGNYAMRVLPSGGADRLVFLAGIGGVTNGFRADWVNASSQMAYRFTDSPTTAAGANATLDSGDNNRLYRSTSSLRYKKDIENIEPDRADAVLNLRPVWYRSKSSVDPNDWSWYGLIAEEVAEIEPRLIHWTYLEEDYEVEEINGRINKTLKENAQKVPDGVQYDRLAVLLIDVVKRQQQAIKDLQTEVAALKSS